MAKNIKPTSQNTPLVSVVMSVYNCEDYVAEAIESILNQTFTDFEFIIINDGSTDGTLKIVKGYKDPRIILISRENKGLVASLNEGISIAKGKYIARQDGDDISSPEKLQKQLELIESSSLVLVSTAFSIFTSDPSKPIAHHCLINDDVLLKRQLFVQNPFGHGAIMFSREAAIKANLYEDIGPAEDYDLWVKLMEKGRFGFVEQECYSWRVNPEGITQKESIRQQECVKRIQKERLQGRPPDLTLHDVNAILGKISLLSPKYREHCLGRVLVGEKELAKRNIRGLKIRTLFIDLFFIFKLIMQERSI